ncbi:ComF family protein [Vicingus serpentipes]|uniref:ComF family protein n=1 Tax=Vicingus serpentipes TaxID=1926625 RepID=A0A5C6RQ76_9FLAO|nr:phosphoribosyltransferase family protein [Vicingus serpentipes]TXB64383.1 ComF family protein [Vicingus serpentipes]
MLNDFFNLIFPKICFACNGVLLKQEEVICTSCQFSLPKTNYHLDEDNPLTKIFWGRVDVKNVAAYYYFKKGGRVQNLLHQLKYKGAKQVGERIGELYGFDLQKSNWIETVDYIIPVPLHSKKLKKRGYNQSECFARGLSKSTNKSLETTILYRKKHSETQTKKSRFNRWENVSEIFDVKNTEKLEGKHILLVDDVITTGATLEASVKVLLKVNCRVSIVTIASA